MKDYKALLKKQPIPKHVAIIMDGNGRWAKKKSLPRSEGHKKGAEIIEPIMEAAIELGVKVISVYAFSTENWSRPKTEVRELWRLLEYFFVTKISRIKEMGIKIKHSGTTKRLPPSIKKTIQQAVKNTEKNKRIVLNFCINYGGRQEIVRSMNSWLEKRKGDEKITESKLNNHLDTKGLPDVDLLIRTSGEYRISNFLLWQCAYAELVFTDVLWPDFKPGHLEKAVYDFQNRERRFGGI